MTNPAETKPTFEEQISAVEYATKQANRLDIDYADALEAAATSLRELQSIRNQPVPVEPFRRFRGVLKPVDRGMWVNGPCDYYHDAEVDTRIDSLQSALKLAQEERDEWERKAGQYMDERDKAEDERDLHYNRLAGLLFSGRLDALTGEDVRGFEKEYVDYKSLNRRMVEKYRDLVVAAENHRCYKAQCGICEALAKLEEA